MKLTTDIYLVLYIYRSYTLTPGHYIDLVDTWKVSAMLHKFVETPIVRYFVKARIDNQLTSACDIGMAFVISSEEAAANLKASMTESATKDVLYRMSQTVAYVKNKLDDVAKSATYHATQRE